MNIVNQTPVCMICFGTGGYWDEEVIDQWYHCNACIGTGYENTQLTFEKSDVMNEQEVAQALEAQLPPEKSLGVFDDLLAGNETVERLLKALTSFLKQYATLPPKEVVMNGFTIVLDKLLAASPFGPVVKKIIKGAALVAASQLYDVLAEKLSTEEQPILS